MRRPISNSWPEPPARVVAIVKDGIGTRALPFPVRRSATDGKFRNALTGDPLMVQIVRWRHPEPGELAAMAKAHRDAMRGFLDLAQAPQP